MNYLSIENFDDNKITFSDGKFITKVTHLYLMLKNIYSKS